MRAVLMTAVGGPGVLELMELPEPEPSREHDVRVRLRAAGINPVDYKLRSYLHRALEAGQVTGKAVLVM